MHYTGTLAANGKEFDSSRKPGRGPFQTAIGVGRVIQGWDQGVPQLSLGERAKLIIPPRRATAPPALVASSPPTQTSSSTSNSSPSTERRVRLLPLHYLSHCIRASSANLSNTSVFANISLIHTPTWRSLFLSSQSNPNIICLIFTHTRGQSKRLLDQITREKESHTATQSLG